MTNSSPSAVPGAKALDVGHELREIGHLAVWTVTSAKPGNGVELLRDGNKDTYWQSDGTQPHLVDIQFQKKMHIKVCCHLHHVLPQAAAVQSTGQQTPSNFPPGTRIVLGLSVR